MRKPLVLATLAACVAAAPAQAASTAQASIDDFSFTLYDLKPGDGIAPSISFANGAFGTRGSRTTAGASDQASGQQSSEGWSLDPLGRAAALAQAGGAAARASLSGSVFAGGVDFRTGGSAAGARVPGLGTFFDAIAQAGSPFDGITFTLAPYTLAIFSGSADLFAQTTVGSEPGTFASESGRAVVGMTIAGTGAGGSGNQSSIGGFDLTAGSITVFDPSTGGFRTTGQTLSLTDAVLTGTFANFTAGNLGGTLTLFASAQGASSVTAVPEPGQTTLLFAGLAALGIAARRRQAVIADQ